MGLTGGMSAKIHIIALSDQERVGLEKISQSNRRSVREKTRARILLLCDTHCSVEDGASCKDAEVARRLGCTAWAVGQVRRRACERGGVIEVVRHKEQEKRKERRLDGRGEAALVAVTCSTPPDGVARWSLRLLRERLIELEVVESIGLETLRTTLKKTRSSRG